MKPARVQTQPAQTAGQSRRRARPAHANSPAHYFDLYELAPVGYVTVDERERIVDANRAAARLLGASKRALLKHPLTRFIAREDRQLYAAYVRTLADTGEPQEFELRMRRADGAAGWMRVQTNLTRDERGAPVRGVILSDITEHKRVEEELRLQSAIASNLAEGVSLVRVADGVIVYCNTRFEEMFGYAPGELVGKPVALLNAPDFADPRNTAQIITTSIQQNQRWSGEIHNIRKDGTRFWSYTSVSQFNHAEHGLVQLAVRQDITARKQIQLALAESEKRYRSIIEDQTELICRFRPDNTLTFVNEAYCRYFGKTRAELIGASFLPFIPPEDQPIIAAQTKRLSVTTPVVYYRHRVILPNGEIRWQHWSDRALFNEHGNLTEYQSVGRDITEHKLIEDALRENEQRYRLLFEQSPDATFILDLQGYHRDANPRASAMLGYTHDELLGLSLRHISAEVPASERVIERLLAGERVPTYERWFRRKSGAVFPVELAVDLIRDLQGKPTHIQSIARDITERKRVEKELAIALTKYKTLFEMFPLGVTIADAQGNIIETNRVAEKLSGVSTAEHLQRDIDGPEWQTVRLDGTPMPPDEYAGVRALKEQRLIENVEMGIIKSPSETTWLNITAAPLPLEGYGVVIAYGDIGARLVAEHALRESEACYRLLADTSSDVIWTCDLNMQLTYISPAVERLTGFSPRQALAQTFAMALMPDSMERANILFTEAAAQIDQPSAQGLAEWSSVAELELRRKDGTTVWTETRLNFILDAHANPSAILGITRDISERKRVEAERAEQRRARELALVYEATRELSVILELPELLETILQRARNLLAVSAGAIYLRDVERDAFELRAQHGALGEVTAVDWRTPTQPWLLATNPRAARVPLLYGDELFGVLFVGEPDTAGAGLTQADLHLLTLFAGQATAALHNLRMFERVRASRAHAHVLAQQLLNAQETERRAIARELHDEIGQALTSVQLSLQNIEPLLPEGDAQDTLEETMHTVERVLDQARDLSRALRPAMLDDFGLVPALRWYLQRQAKRAGFQTAFEADTFATRLPEDIETVCFRIAQEAITNIVRHARADHVAVAVHARAGSLELTIHDNGIGFDLARALNESLHGESIGLLGIRERAALLGGAVDILTAPGQGTQVRVRLPLAEPQAHRGDG